MLNSVLSDLCPEPPATVGAAIKTVMWAKLLFGWVQYICPDSGKENYLVCMPNATSGMLYWAGADRFVCPPVGCPAFLGFTIINGYSAGDIVQPMIQGNYTCSNGFKQTATCTTVGTLEFAWKPDPIKQCESICGLVFISNIN